MPAAAAISGTFSDLKTVKSRSVVQLVIEVPIEQGAAVIEAFGFPQPGAEIHVAVARLIAAPQTIEHEPQHPAKGRRKFEDLPRSQQAGIRCGEMTFWRFLNETDGRSIDDGETAAAVVRERCGVLSRAELDSQPTAGTRWDSIEARFDLWMHHPELVT